MSAFFDKLGNGLSNYLDGPSTWPVPARRIYVLTLPISAPLFVLSFLPIVVGALLCGLCWALFMDAPRKCRDWFRGMWRRP